jgi:hypothetical protein
MSAHRPFWDRVLFTFTFDKMKGTKPTHHGSHSQQQEPGHYPKGGAGYLHLKPGDRFRFFFSPMGLL